MKTVTIKLNILSFTYFFLIFIACNGQKPATNPGKTVSRLSNSIIIIFQSADGDYWLGSDKDGLYKYNGKTITHYSEKDGLSSNRIRSIQEDKQGNIYIAAIGGIYKFDGNTFSKLTTTKNSSPANDWKLESGDLWFSIPGNKGEKGPYRYDGKNLYQLEFPKHYMEEEYYKRFPNNSWSPFEVYYIYKDSKGAIWLGTSNFGICRYDGKSLSWLYEDHLTNVSNGGSFGIRSIIEDSKGHYWFCNTSNRYKVFPDSIVEKDRVLIPYKTEKGIEGIRTTDNADMVYFMSAIEDKNGNLWLATYSQGVWKYDGKTVTHYAVNDGGKEATLFSIYKDKNDNIWLGSHESGAYKFNGKTFEKFNP